MPRHGSIVLLHSLPWMQLQFMAICHDVIAGCASEVGINMRRDIHDNGTRAAAGRGGGGGGQ